MLANKFFNVLLGLIIIFPIACREQAKLQKDYPIQPVPFTAVHINDAFWQERLETNRTVTIPYAFEKCKETGRIQNFEVAGGLKEGTFEGKYPFNDSDVYKIVEGAAYALHVRSDPELGKYLDELIAKVAAAQEEDGYLYTARTINPGKPVIWVEGERWSNMYLGHELYNMGHFYEAAVAHYMATGKRSLLNLALKNADLIASVFGPDKKRSVPGHQVIETGLAKLYRVTGKQKYLDLAKFFLDERGRPNDRELYGEYSQDHIPVVEQTEAVGHAVRAAYMYAGMTDIAALAGDKSYIAAIDSIWDSVVSKKLYLTGGIGATNSGEAFGKNYDLPNETAYAETCAAIANVFWNHRMFLLHGDAKYIDVLERVVYNGLLSGVSFSGDRFFYPNPLKSSGQHERSPWFGCACCPSNIARFMPSFPGYIYAVKDTTLYVNLFVQGDATVKLENNSVKIEQTTTYPYDGKIKIALYPGKTTHFTVRIRIPGWAKNQPVPGGLYRYLKESSEKVVLKVNDAVQPVTLDKGFACISREWHKGNTLELNLPMPVRRVVAHADVEADRGRVALERGPLVFCAEGIDNRDQVENLVVSADVKFSIEKKEVVGHELFALTAEVDSLIPGKKKQRVEKKKHHLVLVPYYAWAHRGKNKMAV
ncbi:glycoside hydrolase family 127 protein [Acidobacteriota bacterium]